MSNYGRADTYLRSLQSQENSPMPEKRVVVAEPAKVEGEGEQTTVEQNRPQMREMDEDEPYLEEGE